MIITRTPFRISFAGGGSDIATFYHRHDGCVISTSIDKYMYITIHPSFNQATTSIKYSKTETVEDVKKIQHPIARQALLDFGISGVEISSTADVPSGTGLSTSSAYTVGLIQALCAYTGKYLSQEEIAETACDIEINKLKEPIGKQDQYGVAVGGLKKICFHRNGEVDVEPIIMKQDTLKQLNESLMLFYTGLTHNAGDILTEQNSNVDSEESKFSNMLQMVELAKTLHGTLVENDLSQFGHALHQGWMLKRELANSITCPKIDAYYDKALANGALGGKLLGAGGGGFLLFFCDKNQQSRLRAALSDLLELPFSMEGGGTKVIYVGNKNL